MLRLQSLGPAVQEAHGILDPLLLGVRADLLVLFGLEAVGTMRCSTLRILPRSVTH